MVENLLGVQSPLSGPEYFNVCSLQKTLQLVAAGILQMLGPVVQRIVSLTSSLVVIMLTVQVSKISK